MKSKLFTLKIKEDTIDNVYQLALEIPEFSDAQYSFTEYEKRLSNVEHLTLIAYNLNEPVGFKAGYKREEDGSFYSWMGGVIPEARQKNVAQALAEHQEKWARENGYTSVKMKTRNRNSGMLLFALKNGFEIIGVEHKRDIADNRIWLEKKLKNARK